MDKSNINIYSTMRSASAIFVSSAIIFTALTNSLTWHIHRLWGASKDFWQAIWDSLIDNYCGDERIFYTIGTSFILIVIYWFVGAIYTIMDITNKPKFLRKYKIQPGMNEPVEKDKLIKAIKQVLINQLLTIPLTYLSYSWLKARGLPDIRELPTFHWALFQIISFILLEEIGFYYTHRLLHHRWIYKYVHKIHHEWTAPISITAIYCHPIEHLFSNVFPIFLGTLIMGSHIATSWLWFTMAIVNTLNDHSGYHLPFMSSSEYHDYHHLKYNQCFGVLGFLDRLHGTDAQFRKSKAFSRHYMNLSLRSVRDIHPDEDKVQKTE